MKKSISPLTDREAVVPRATEWYRAPRADARAAEELLVAGRSAGPEEERASRLQWRRTYAESGPDSGGA